jgi:regulator of replication initiation timing
VDAKTLADNLSRVQEHLKYEVAQTARLRAENERLRRTEADERALYLAALAVLAAWEHIPATGELSAALHRLRGAVLDVERAP